MPKTISTGKTFSDLITIETQFNTQEEIFLF